MTKDETSNRGHHRKGDGENVEKLSPLGIKSALHVNTFNKEASTAESSYKIESIEQPFPVPFCPEYFP